MNHHETLMKGYAIGPDKFDIVLKRSFPVTAVQDKLS